MEELLKINDLDKFKITSIKQKNGVIHFKYNNEFYFIHENNDETTVTQLYKGRCRGQTQCLKSIWGFINNLIKYKNNKRVLSSIDKNYFVKKLYGAGLIDTDIEKIKEEINYKTKRIKELNEIITNAQEEIRKLNWD